MKCQIFTIRQLSEKILEKNKQMTIACLNLEKAYDKVCRENLWRMLVRYKLGGHLQRAIQSFTGRVKHVYGSVENCQDGSLFIKVFGKGV